MSTYAGLAECTRYAQSLAADGWTLRTGGAPGADQAFERGVRSGCELYLPWPDFEARTRSTRAPRLRRPSAKAYEVAAEHHPAWGRVGRGGQALLARNAHIILGANLDDPVDLVVCCWYGGSGGTRHALSIASAAGIEVVNLAWGTRRLDELLAGQVGGPE